MKKITLAMMAFLLFSYAKANDITPPSEGKAVVYFVRISGLGALINFSYFDKDKFIGKFNGTGYLRYECEPGEHVFWVRSENRDFITADLEAGKIYFIEAVPQMGAIKARVEFKAINPKEDTKRIGKIEKLVHKKEAKSFTAEYLETENQKLKDDIQKGLERYQELVAKQEQIIRLNKEMFYEKQVVVADTEAKQ